MLANKLLSAIAGGEEKLYVDDVFSAYTYTGNGSTQTINNGIDLAGKGGLVWTKVRQVNSSGIITASHDLRDSARGLGNYLSSNNTAGNSAVGIMTLESNGYSCSGSSLLVGNTADFVSWTFRKAPKFFDVVTWTSNGSALQQINHALGGIPGMIIVKRTDNSSNWFVWHRMDGTTPVSWLSLNLTNAGISSVNLNNGITSTYISAISIVDSGGSSPAVNGATYVAYLFAHDPSADGLIQCGSYVGNGGAQSVNLGWEPQFLLVKNTSGASGIQDWVMLDQSRGINTGSADSMLRANVSSAENIGNDFVDLTATGFYLSNSNVNQHPLSYIYLAIRRPNKPPTTGTQVYNAIARTGTGAAATVTGVGFAPDLVLQKVKSPASYPDVWVDRLRGTGLTQDATKWLVASYTNGAENTMNPGGVEFTPDGMKVGTYININQSGDQYIDWFFKRAPGFFDVVCYTGDGTAGNGRAVTHGLGVAPELLIVKSRSAASTNWSVWQTAFGTTGNVFLNSAAAVAPAFYVWANNYLAVTSPATQFGVYADGTNNSSNTLNATYVAYLFASLPGINKVGSYTGNGSSQTINCGFSTGARFILIKRTDSTGDWYVWDAARGIVSANDPHLSLNTADAEVTTNDSVDPESAGFVVNQVAATNINVTSATYIYLAIA